MWRLAPGRVLLRYHSAVLIITRRSAPIVQMRNVRTREGKHLCPRSHSERLSEPRCESRHCPPYDAPFPPDSETRTLRPRQVLDRVNPHLLCAQHHCRHGEQSRTCILVRERERVCGQVRGGRNRVPQASGEQNKPGSAWGGGTFLLSLRLFVERDNCLQTLPGRRLFQGAEKKDPRIQGLHIKHVEVMKRKHADYISAHTNHSLSKRSSQVAPSYTAVTPQPGPLVSGCRTGKESVQTETWARSPAEGASSPAQGPGASVPALPHS